MGRRFRGLGTHDHIHRSSASQVFVRGGLQAAILDGPEHSAWSNVKHSTGTTNLSCQRCEVPREHLGNPRFDFRKKQRTAEGVDAGIEYVKEGASEAERVKRGKRCGVVVPEVPNPLKKLTFDRQLQFPFDILHQDALASGLLCH